MNEKKLILNWLKNKSNYIYFVPDGKLLGVRNQIGRLLHTALIHHDQLEPHDCYFIKDKINIKIEMFRANKRYTFNNFNIPKNECIFDVEHMYILSRNSGYRHEKLFKYSIVSFIMQIVHSFRYSNNFISSGHCFNLNYDKIIHKTVYNKETEHFEEIKYNKKTILEYTKPIHKLFKTKNFRKDLWLWIRQASELTKDINEVGIFYPFKIDHDIFEQKFYLVELNPIKFARNNINIAQKIRKFFRDYEINYDNRYAPLTIEKYFKLDNAVNYKDDFAYFDPFKFYNKHKVDFIELLNHVIDKKMEISIFINDLFEFFNNVQYDTICIQHNNLLKKIITYRSKNRQNTLLEIAETEIIKIDTMVKNNKNLPIYVLKHLEDNKWALIEICNRLKISKNLSFDDLKSEYQREILIEAFKELQKYKSFTTMNDMLKQYNEKMNDRFKKYLFENKHKKIILNIIKDLMTFYSNQDEEDFTQVMNKKLYDVFFNNKKKKVNFNFTEEFILEYTNEFDVIHSTNAKKSLFVKLHPRK